MVCLFLGTWFYAGSAESKAFTGERNFSTVLADTLTQVTADTADTAAADTLIIHKPSRDSVSVLPFPRSFLSTPPFLRDWPRILEIRLNDDRFETERDTLGNYHVRRTLGEFQTGYTATFDFETYAAKHKQSTKRESFQRLIREEELRRDARRGLLDFRITIPGGQSSAFTTIFGRPEVNLRVTGSANMNVGVSISDTEDPALPADQRRRVDPKFDQNLQLNIQGTIGDKLTISTDWDTERSFEYENRLNILYTGYEDEIIQSIELGNVSMETGNSLIRGGGSLFGIKAQAKLGALEVTTVLSQQEGQGETQTISGGSQEQQIDIAPNAYEDDRHFFIDFYARQEFEEAMSNPVVTRRLFDIVNIDVYVENTSSTSEPDQRRAIALLDYGVVQGTDGFSPPNEEQDIFDPGFLEQFRDPSVGVSASDLDVPSDEFVENNFIPLTEGVDYDVNQSLGYISLRFRLENRQALAVSYSYRDQAGNIVYVGDPNQGDSQRLFLKLLRPTNQSPTTRAWPLTMRNIYSLNASNLTRDDLELDVFYTGGTTDQTNIPGLNNILLRDLGLDRVDQQGSPSPDNRIDFNTETLDPVNGRVIFPFLEPFGQRIVDIIEASNLPQDQKDEAISRYAFTDLYNQRPSNAGQNSRNAIYRLKGSARGGVSDTYFLNFALVPGSVRVTANGIELTENVDYQVDYIVGNIVITNRQYLASGQEIEIEYESNQLLQIQQTTFTGVRAQYNFSDDIRVGGTFFRLKERPIQDKIPVGDEPINNTILGFDARARIDTPWLTRALDAVPLLSTRADSRIEVSGEWAQLRPGVSQTNAVQRAIDGGELYPDEEEGLAFIDDFEGSKSTISFMNPGRWNLASAPYWVPGRDLDPENANQSVLDRADRADRRGKFAWYMIPSTISRSQAVPSPESELVRIRDVFPNRQISAQEQDILQTLDIYYNPRERGPYNYNMELRDFLENRPEEMWGGMTAVLPGGLGDFTQQNIEYLEFWFQTILPDAREPGLGDLDDYDGTIYFDIGTVSEDVIPNNNLNSEDGLFERENNLRQDQLGRSYILNSPVEFDGQFSVANIEREDVGLDGAPSFGNDGFNEQTLFADFISQMEAVYADQPERVDEIRNDPSNDNFIFYDNSLVRNLPLHERFHRMYGYLEGNSITSGSQRAVTNRPDSEGLLNPSVVNLEDSFFQFEFPWNPADPESDPAGYVVDRLPGDSQTNTWYQVRIPIRDFARQIGNIEDLQRVTHLRMWMAGYSEPFTVRFATLEFVGNLWRKAEDVGNTEDETTLFDISTINFEENSLRQPVPYRIPKGAIRSSIRGQQETIFDNEQSLVLTVQNLKSQDVRMVSRIYPGNLSLVNYSNLRMFVHGEGYANREDVEVVIRMGSNLETNYYEYRQPVTPTDTTHVFGDPADQGALDIDTEMIWMPDENSVNIVLATFNELKQLRNLDPNVDRDLPFERTDIVRDAPPGATLAIVGNPSLDRITEIGIGIRNPHRVDYDTGGPNPFNNNSVTANRGIPSLDAELWVNELRVSGFDNRRAWSGNVQARVTMADFATLNATFSHTQDGFGSLSDRMIDRRKSDQTTYNFNTTVNMHKFIPERYGWNIPVSFSMRNQVSTPRFLPREGDVRFSDFRSAVEAEIDDPDERARIIDERLEQIQDRSESYSINVTGLTKNNSRSQWLINTLDAATWSYNYTTSTASNPTTQFNDSWNYSLGLNYNLNFRNVRTVRPFGFTEDIPVLGVISGIRLAYMPTSIGTQQTLERRYSERQQRSFEDQDPFQLQQQHQFNYVSTFNLNYDIMPPISLRFNNRTEYNFDPLSREFDFVGEDSTLYNIRPSFDVLQDVLFDPDVEARREQYSENYTATWRPRFNQIRSLSWMQYNANYRGGFTWRNSPEGSGLGANLTNTFSLDHTFQMRFQDLIRRIPFYDNLVTADEAERRARDQRARQRRETRQRERDERRREREEQRARERGEEVEEDPRRPQQNNRGSRGGQQAPEDREFDLMEEVRFYGRRLVLSAFSFQNIDINYGNSRTTGLSGYDGGASIFNMFNDETDGNYSPNFGYRIGLDSSVPFAQFVRPEDEDEVFSLSQNENTSNDMRLRTRLAPFRDFTVDLNWNIRWRENRQNSFTVFPDSIGQQFTLGGEVETSVWAFGDNYRSIFRRQLQTAFDNLDPDGGTTIRPEFGDTGDMLLSPNTIQRHFRSSYLAGFGSTVDDKGYMPFPMPTWTINWGGWERRLPFVGSFLNRLSLSHNYTSNYRLQWRFFPDAGAEVNRRVGIYDAIDSRNEFEPSSITLTRSFSPFIGVNMTFRNGIRATINYNRSHTTNFSISNSNVTEAESQALMVQFGYSVRGFRLPFFRRFQNTLDLNLNVNYAEDKRLTYLLNNDLQDVLGVQQEDLVLDPNFYEPETPNDRGDARITITPSIGYTFSQTIRANFEYRYFQLIPRSSNVFPRVDQDIMFNIVVTIRS